MTTVTLACPVCGRRITVPADRAGQAMWCGTRPNEYDGQPGAAYMQWRFAHVTARMAVAP